MPFRPDLCAFNAAAGFAVSVLVFYPGIFTPDSMVQFEQANSGQFTDWHPPIMAALWRLLNAAHRGPELLFLLHLALFWSGAFAIGDALKRRQAAWVLFPLVGLLPFVFNYLGLLWKDVALASAWLFAAGWTFQARSAGRRAPAWESLAIWAAFFYGALVRSNSIFAAAPLALYLLDRDVLAKVLWPQLAALILAPALLLVSAHIVNVDLLRAEHEHPEDSIMLFDLAGISHAEGRNLLPGPWTPAQAQRIPDCYHPDKWDWLGEGDCAFIGQTYDNLELWGSPIISHAWLEAVRRYPGAYIQHRVAFMNQLLRLVGPIPAHDAWMNSKMRDPRYAHHPGLLFNAYGALTARLESTPLFRPCFWLLLGAVMFGVSFTRTDTPARRFASAMSASAIIYLLTYALFGVASDFRYAYWSIVAVAAATAAICASAPSSGSRGDAGVIRPTGG